MCIVIKSFNVVMTCMSVIAANVLSSSQEFMVLIHDLLITIVICISVVLTVFIIGHTIIKYHTLTLNTKDKIEHSKMTNELDRKNDEINRKKEEWNFIKTKREESKEDSFVEFCQNEKCVTEKLVNICADYYKAVMARRLNI